MKLFLRPLPHPRRLGRAAPLACLAAALVAGCGKDRDEFRTAEVTAGPLEVWTVFGGRIESADVRSVASDLNGPATLVELAGDGARVRAGDVLVRFDASQWERDLARLERDAVVARAELDSLVRAKLPLEQRELELREREADRACADERQSLADTRQLRSEELVSDQDVRQQEARAAAAEAALGAVREQILLTREHLHPAAVDRARATLSSAAQELDLARRQLSNCVVRAPLDGIVAYKPLAVGGEFRAVRTGDTVYRNQPFLVLPNMSNLVVRCSVPESEMGRIALDAPAEVTVAACPDLALAGKVESIGAMALGDGGGRGAAPYFPAAIRLPRADPRLRHGMSARARVLTYAAPEAVRVPRAAVTWKGGQAACRRLKDGRLEEVVFRAGWANDAHVEALDGLKPGDRVSLP